jgi:diguanylate cyclase (GGDEF)-like protein/PAS domain S-box-containing protein
VPTGLLSRTTLSALGIVLPALLVFGAAAAVTLSLKHAGEDGFRAERDLQGVVAELHHQDGLEWRAISGRVPPDALLADLRASRAQAAVLAERAVRGGLARVDHARLTALTRAYAEAVDEELRLLTAGQTEQAEEFDEATVDPAFEAALESVSGSAASVSARAARARSLSDVGVLLTLGVALLLTAVVQGRRRLAEVRRRVERKSEARYRALIDQSTDLVLVADHAGLTQYLSPAAERLFAGRGQSANLMATVHPEDRETLAVALTAARTDRIHVIELRLPAEQGWRTFETALRDLTGDPAVGGVVLTCHDVTERQALQRELEHRALHDTLTGLANRALLADRFEHALRVAHRDGHAAALLVIDLDRFKDINDTLGHHYGDQLLVQLGPRLAGVLRETDTVARLGGDEFAVLLPRVPDTAAAIEVAHTIQAALAQPFPVGDITLDVESSIGIVVSGEHGDDATTLMQRADIAMYVAKQRNLGVSTYDPDSDSHSPERLALLGDLRRAISSGELLLHYQPKVSLSTGEICGAEALLRWQHPQRGLILPDAFIPLAENTGLIGPLTRFVLGAALVQARAWADAGRPLQVAVNLSARNLLDDGLDAMVVDLLAAHGVEPGLLKLEVTESAIMSDPVRAKALLERLSAHGIAISIDDFGVGYTSLAQLKNLPVSELKVDRSFVTTMTADVSNNLIVRSVIELSHNLGLSAVAEGVESAQTLDRLAAYDCDVAQGYHLSRPLPGDAFDRWRAAWPGLPTVAPAP